MPDELIQPASVNKDMLLQLFQDAYMDASLDDDGDIKVKEDYAMYVYPADDGRTVRLVIYFRAAEGAAPEAKLAYVNRVNDTVLMVRATLLEHGSYAFDYYISVQGGITKQAIVFAAKRFLTTVRSALDRDTDNVVG